MRTSALTRALVSLSALLLVAGCSTAAAPQAGATRTVTHVLGTAQVPAEPTRVVVLDEYSAMNAHTLGVDPLEVFGSAGSEVSARVLRDAGITVTPALGLHESPPIEAITALKPDLVLIGGGEEVRPIVDRIAPVAPVVVLPYYGATWQDNLRATGAALNRAARADALVGTLEQRISAVHGDHRTVSMVGSSGGHLFAPGTLTPITAILRDAGFTRPADQQAAGDGIGSAQVIPLSAEVLGRHDGDVVVVPQGVYYDAAAVRAVPTFAQLPAVRDGRVLTVDGDMWFGNFAFAIDWIVTDLEGITRGAGQAGVGAADDVPARWAAFRERTAS